MTIVINTNPTPPLNMYVSLTPPFSNKLIWKLYVKCGTWIFINESIEMLIFFVYNINVE